MKTIIAQIKKILHEYKEDIKYSFIAGIPALIMMLIVNRCMDYSHLY